MCGASSLEGFSLLPGQQLSSRDEHRRRSKTWLPEGIDVY